MVGWGFPDLAYPTDDNGWAHCLTIPRQLSLRDGKLIQQPVAELVQLRKQEEGTYIRATMDNESRSFTGFNGISYELICEISHVEAEIVGIEFRASETEKTVLLYDRIQHKVVLDRTGAELAEQNGVVRRCTLTADVIKFHLFVDASSVEIFVNDGEEVFTSRIFPSPDSVDIRFFARGGKADFEATHWDY
ncbi:GH32 C-terminal domain-containing protein [Paenibacillus amylolyticus]|nr:GH32 C-terminal domain-containing protein [Paenibacillus amylolyticus]